MSTPESKIVKQAVMDALEAEWRRKKIPFNPDNAAEVYRLMRRFAPTLAEEGLIAYSWVQSAMNLQFVDIDMIQRLMEVEKLARELLLVEVGS